MDEEMLELQANESENVETQTTEENVEGIELTDTTNVDEPTEEKADVKKTLKQLLEEDETYQKEFNTMIQTRLKRKDREYQRELSKYKDTENVLRTTLNVAENDDVNTKLREYYEAEGVKLPEVVRPGLSEREIEILANAEAEDIIADGYEAMREEANSLARREYKNLNPKEKIIFNKLAEKLTEENNRKELLRLGAKEELLKDENFKEFKSQFNHNTPIEKIYGLYMKTEQSKKQIENPGSLKSEKVKQPKTQFTSDDILKMSDEELEANWEAIRKYQTSGNKL